MHVCSFVQTSPAPHVPHDPPQPSSPRSSCAIWYTRIGSRSRHRRAYIIFANRPRLARTTNATTTVWTALSPIANGFTRRLRLVVRARHSRQRHRTQYRKTPYLSVRAFHLPSHLRNTTASHDVRKPPVFVLFCPHAINFYRPIIFPLSRSSTP